MTSMKIKRSLLNRIDAVAKSVLADIIAGTLLPGTSSCSLTMDDGRVAPCCTLGHFYDRLGVLDGPNIEQPIAKLIGLQEDEEQCGYFKLPDETCGDMRALSAIVPEVLIAMNAVYNENDRMHFRDAGIALNRIVPALEKSFAVDEEG